MDNSVNPDQMALSNGSWSGSSVFSKMGKFPIQQNKGKCTKMNFKKSADEKCFLKYLYLAGIAELLQYR